MKLLATANSAPVVLDGSGLDYSKLESTKRSPPSRRVCSNKTLLGSAVVLLLLTAGLVVAQLFTAADDTRATDLASVSASGSLTIPNFVSDHEREARAAEIRAFTAQISNEKRTWRIGGVDYPFYDGPVPRPGSLAAKIQLDEIAQLTQFENPDSYALYTLVMRSKFETLEDYQIFYDNATRFAPKPVSIDPSDESFGYQRLTTKAFSLRAFRAGNDSLPSDPALADAPSIAKICGSKQTSLSGLAESRSLYVTDFSDYSAWSESGNAKYVASVVAFFCYNDEASKLLPIAIHIVDTNVTYTPFDKSNEWTLAKMAVDAAEISFQQMQHYADTHAIFLPMRIEAMRHLASQHPVHALLMRSSKLDFGLESLAARILLNESTPLDMTFGFGAVGCTKFLGHQLAQLSISHDFDADIKSRGLEHLPIHKYATYGRLYFDAISAMLEDYLKAYYPSDGAVAGDSELQSWAKGCAAIAQLRDFPSQFETVSDLRRLLTHILFQTFIRHHAMNGATSWDSVSVPYSTPALWKPLPTRKLADGESLNILDYSTPKLQLPVLIVLSLSFRRRVPESESVLSVFKSSPFSEENQLTTVIAAFERALQSIDARIGAAEEGEARPYTLLRPAMLARSGWI